MQAFLTGWIIVVRGEGRGKKFDNPLMPNKAIAIVFFFFFFHFMFFISKPCGLVLLVKSFVARRKLGTRLTNVREMESSRRK